jgi:hypothetical protein
MNSDIISVAEAARMLRAEKHFVIASLLRGELRAVGNGPTIWISRSAVERFRREHPHPAESIRQEDESIVRHSESYV